MELPAVSFMRSSIKDEAIIELYWMRDQKAIELTDTKYRHYLMSIAYNIVHDKLDCQECLNDTYLGAWNAMPPSRPTVLKAFLTAIMRRIAVNRYHSNQRKRIIPSEMTVSLSEMADLIANEQQTDEEFDAQQLGYIISGFVRSLSPRRRFIFMSRYYGADSIATIAHTLGLSKSMVNKELASIRALLKEIVASEGYSV